MPRTTNRYRGGPIPGLTIIAMLYPLIFLAGLCRQNPNERPNAIAWFFLVLWMAAAGGALFGVGVYLSMFLKSL
jgi:hypothetical protein